jgi:hypothetical protein
MRFLSDKHSLMVKAFRNCPDRMLTHTPRLFPPRRRLTRLRDLLYRLNDEDRTELKATNGALGALSKHVPAGELVKHIAFMRTLIASAVSDARLQKGESAMEFFFYQDSTSPKVSEDRLQ